MKKSVEMTQVLRYKLRIFGIRLTEPASVYCDNEVVYNNVSITESVLKKNHHLVSYHAYRESVVSDMIMLAKEYTMKIFADLFTKKTPKVVRGRFLDMFMY